MAMDTTPWLIGGGAEHTAETARMLAYVATGGHEGVAEPGDFKVTPLSTPGGGVRVAPGGVLVRNTNPGGSQQTYAGRNASTETVDVQAAGSSSGRADMIAVVVRDPQYPGTAVPSDPVSAQYIDIEVIQGVPSNARTAADAGVSYPVYPLARINLPASTGTVQASHITDLRNLANARTERFYSARNLNQGEEQGAHTNSTVWPTAATTTTRVPDWATRVKVAAHWGTLRTGPTSSNPAHGNVTLALVHPDGSERVTQASRWTSGTEEGQRFHIALGHVLSLPSKWRGVDVTVEMRGVRNGGNSSPTMDSMSSYIIDLWFEEAAI